MSRAAHILLVEDRRLDVELTLDAFREADLHNTVQVAWTGEQALDYLFGRGAFEDRDAHPLPDLVLLDLKLPGIDGHEVLRQIKATPVLKRVPVVVLTSSREERDLVLSYQLGVNSFVVKPVDFSAFLQAIQDLGMFWGVLNEPPPRGVRT